MHAERRSPTTPPGTTESGPDQPRFVGDPQPGSAWSTHARTSSIGSPPPRLALVELGERGPMTGERDPDDLVVLVDEDGNHIGTAPRMSVHTEDTPLHLAFSAYLFDRDGRLLVTRRALGKRTWPGVWTNACCGHLRPGESVFEAAARRIPEELGTAPIELRMALPGYRYRAVDASGLVEHELCPVLVGVIEAGALDPDPDEVAEWQWVRWRETAEAMRAAPFAFSPWSIEQVGLLAEAGALEAGASAACGHGGGATEDADGDAAVAAGLAAFLAAVDRRLDAAIDRLEDDWATLGAGLPLDILPQDLPAWLRRLLRGGKRFRARMAYLGFTAVDAAGRQGSAREAAPTALVDLAAALEALHLFGLVHDDVMDESDSRRGGPSAHRAAEAWHADAGALGGGARFGESLAVLLGDLAHTIADRLAAELPAPLREEWFALCIELIAGQRADLTGAAAARRDLEDAALVARLKSSRYTIERPLALGAQVAEAGPAHLAALEAWGEHAGRAFALRDDALGAWGDPEATGKPAGDDLLEAKPTAILALAAERLDGEAAAALDRLGTPRLREGDVALVAEALQHAGIRDEVEAMIADDVARADAALADAPLDPAGVAALGAAIRSIAWRNA